jgi:3-oxoacyl-[acyl-carrier protein] reductase
MHEELGMSDTLGGKTLIVTGAARGLGRVMAIGLLKAGANVAAMDRADLGGLQGAAAGMADRLRLVEGSVTDPSACEDAVRRASDSFGAVHGLVNNAGIGMHAVNPRFISDPTPFWKVDPELWKRLIETNTTGQFLMARAITPALVKQGWGRIVNVSTSFSTMLRKEGSPYGPSKAAVEASTAVWAKDLAGTGVSVNALLPGGPADTPAITDREAFGQLIDPVVMVPPLVWLCSEASDGVSGRRFIGKDWDSCLNASAAAAMASGPAGW